MITRLRRWTLGTRPGTSYVEFGLLCPLLITTFGSVADFGLSIWARSRLSSAVSNGAQYAALAGPGSLTAAHVQSAVSSAVTPLTGVTVTITPSTGLGCYCTSGTPVSMTPATPATPSGSPPSCSGATCASGSVGMYVGITANYTYSPLMPFYSEFASTALSETAIVRLQ